MRSVKIKARTVPESLGTIQHFVRTALAESGFSARTQAHVELCTEEVFVNICRYSGAPSVRVEMALHDHAADITFIDSGLAFDPLSQPAPDVTLGAEERDLGGLGIYMVQSMADDVSYRHEDGKNILRLTFRKD